MRHVPIEEAFDLHSFLPTDIASAVEEYLREAVDVGFHEVRLIHGKGTGVRRAQVRRLLEAHPAVDEFFDAPPQRGGMGATVVKLKRKTEN
jgi:DNA-nicking Smr family endonuclease